MKRLALVVDDVDIERRIRDALGAEAFRRTAQVERPGRAESPEETATKLAESGPDVVVLAPPTDVGDALRIAAAIDHEHPEITVILVADPTPPLWERALRAGVREIIPTNAKASAYAEILERALQAAEILRSHIIDLRDSSGGEGRIITVLSPKGGAGKTTIATNLAVGLARNAPDGVAIVDLDLQFGDVASALQLVPDLSLADLAPGEAERDPARVKLLLTHHHEGLFALCAPDDPAAADGISSDEVAPMLHALADELPYVVVDTCAGIDPHTLAAIEVSTDIILLGVMDVPSVRSLRKLIDALDRLGMTDARRIVVLNRSDSHVDLDVSDVAAAIGLPIAVAIPSSRSVPLSTNHGSPVLVYDPGSPVVRPLRELISLFTGEAPPAARSHSLFRRSTHATR